MSEQPEPPMTGWLKLSLLGWLVHVALAAGVFLRVAVVVPRTMLTIRDFNMKPPGLTEMVLSLVGAAPGVNENTIWGLAALSLFDLAVLVYLARYMRPAWNWWFWGVIVLLLLGLLIVEAAMALPLFLLREALSK